MFTWDVDIVLKYVNSLSINDKLSLKDLSQKLAVLLAMAAACRSSEIYISNVNYMVWKDDCYIFYFHKRGKMEKKQDVS